MHLGLITALLLTLTTATAQSAELKIYAVGSAGPILRELAPMFERTTGHKLAVSTGTSGETSARIVSGQGDVGIVSQALLADLEARGRVVPGSATVIAKSSAGVAGAKGRPLDVSTPEALKSAILTARTIATVDPARGSVLGTHMQAVADKLGVGNELRAKLRLYAGGVTVGQAIAKGDADIGVGFIPELASIEGITVAGPLPPQFDYSSLSTVILVAGSKELEAGKSFAAFLRTPAAQAVIRSKGMVPL